MKKLILIAALINFSMVSGQAFTGNGDKKFQVGANVQNNGTGISATYDFGAGENISFGLTSIYLLSVNSALQNNDGNDDVYFGGSKFNPAKVYLQKEGLYEEKKIQIFENDSINEDVVALIADFNNDGHQDLFVSNGILRRPNGLDFKK